MLLNTISAALALASTAMAMPTGGLEIRQAQTLHAAIVAKGRSYFGTSITIRNDNTEMNLIRQEFGSITPGKLHLPLPQPPFISPNAYIFL